jgi:hypothetical protein
MKVPQKLKERLQFLARVIEREMAHLQTTDQGLFVSAFTVEDARNLNENTSIAEKVDAFVSRFGRLQDTVGDKLLPAWREALGEVPGAMTDNLDRAERLGLIESGDLWLTLRNLRNQMVHEYIEDPAILADALQTAHVHVSTLIHASRALLGDLAGRGIISGF